MKFVSSQPKPDNKISGWKAFFGDSFFRILIPNTNYLQNSSKRKKNVSARNVFWNGAMHVDRSSNFWFFRDSVDMRHQFNLYIVIVPREVNTKFSRSDVAIVQRLIKNCFRSYRNVIESLGKWVVPNAKHKQNRKWKRNKQFFSRISKNLLISCIFVVKEEKLKHIIITCDWNAMRTNDAKKRCRIAGHWAMGLSMHIASHIERNVIT